MPRVLMIAIDFNPIGKDDRIVCSNILLEIIHLLFCRQWKIITATRLPIKDAKSNK
jgi:hypothetical protein